MAMCSPLVSRSTALSKAEISVIGRAPFRRATHIPRLSTSAPGAPWRDSSRVLRPSESHSSIYQISLRQRAYFSSTCRLPYSTPQETGTKVHKPARKDGDPSSASPSASIVSDISNASNSIPPTTSKAPTQPAFATHENIYTLPNFLTLTRFLSAPAIGYMLHTGQYIPAFYVLVYAGVTDLVDGWLARRYGMASVVGTILDPMADKALMTVVTIVLAYKGAIPLLLTTLILGRDVALGISAFYYRYISLPPPKTLARFWDFSLPSAEVTPTTISKINTFLQLGLVGATMAWMAFFEEGQVKEEGRAEGNDAVASQEDTREMASSSWYTRIQHNGPTALQASWWIVGFTTVWSGLSYVGWGRRRGLRILSPSSIAKKARSGK